MTSAAAPTPATRRGEAARASQEPLAASIRLAGAQPHPSAGVRLAALLVALAAHAAVFYALTREPPDLMAGGRGHLLDAVSVTIVNSAVFEARQDVLAPPAPATADTVEANEGTVDSKAGPQQPEQKEDKAEVKKAPDEPVPAEAVVKAAPSVLEPPKEQERERKEVSTAAAAVGGAAARGDALGAEKQSAPAAASPGAVREYERYVSQALARTKPKGGLGYGTVKVKLVISPDGGLASVEIIKSSGNRRLDEAALAAVRRAKFPTPPAGMTDRQRWFEFPYYFR